MCELFHRSDDGDYDEADWREVTMSGTDTPREPSDEERALRARIAEAVDAFEAFIGEDADMQEVIAIAAACAVRPST